MNTHIGSLISFLAILNPFALCLYLIGVMDDLEYRDFIRVLIVASTLSFVVFCIFALAGEPLLTDILGVSPHALRVFGGVIFFMVAYNYVTRGYRAAEMLRGSLEELPSAIALPYMIGAGTLTQAILIGKQNERFWPISILFLGVATCFLVVVGFKLIRDHMKTSREHVFIRYVNILSRVNGLIIGAISTEMILSGAKHLWLAD